LPELDDEDMAANLISLAANCKPIGLSVLIDHYQYLAEFGTSQEIEHLHGIVSKVWMYLELLYLYWPQMQGYVSIDHDQRNACIITYTQKDLTPEMDIRFREMVGAINHVSTYDPQGPQNMIRLLRMAEVVRKQGYPISLSAEAPAQLPPIAQFRLSIDQIREERTEELFGDIGRYLRQFAENKQLSTWVAVAANAVTLACARHIVNRTHDTKSEACGVHGRSSM